MAITRPLSITAFMLASLLAGAASAAETPSNDSLFTPSPAPQAAASPVAQNNGEQIDITADNSLEWNEHERVYVARGNAKAKRGDVTIEADILKAYDRQKQDGSSEVWRMVAEGNVRILSKENRASGSRGEYDIDTRKAVLTGDNLSLKTATDTVTAKKSLEYWEIEQMALAKGDAVAIRDGRKVKADEMVARLAPDAKGELVIQTMEAKGNVDIVTTEDAIQCDHVIYDMKGNKATLIGNVSITRDKNQLKGDRVETDFTTGKSRLLNSGSGRVHALISGAKSKNTPGRQPTITPFLIKKD